MAVRGSLGVTFALSLGAALAVACSSSPNASNDGGNSGDNGGFDSGLTPKDAGIQPADASTQSCATAAPASYTFSPPKLARGSCSQATLFQLAALGTSATLTTVTGIINADVSEPACQACVGPSNESDPKWGVLVARSTTAPVGHPVNWGGCLVGAGGSSACAAALQKFQDCAYVACLSCADNTSYANCGTQIQLSGGACAQAGTDLTNACQGPADQAASAKCNTVQDAITYMCGPTGTDGGTDGSTDASAG